MTDSVLERDSKNGEILEDTKDFLTVIIAGQRFGIPILQIQDVLGEHNVTTIPLAPTAVAGSLNLRGRVVTAINVRNCLSLKPSDATEAETQQMSVVVEHGDELYSLIIDSVGDVLTLPNKNFEQNPATMESVWRDVSMGIYRLEGELLVVLDVPRLLDSVAN